MEAWDISSAALDIAARNAKQHGCDIDLRKIDALNPESWKNHSQLFDFIVSNPPYIAHGEIPNLPISVVKYEPSSALFAEQSGLAFYQCFAKYAGNCLVPGGKIFLEIASHQAIEVCLILESENWHSINVSQDLAGLDRVIEAERPLV
jgi:release factor glutamine methyltransferase